MCVYIYICIYHHNHNHNIVIIIIEDMQDSSIPSCTRFKCTRTFWYYGSMFVLTSKHKQGLRKGVTSIKKSTYIRSTYKREC